MDDKRGNNNVAPKEFVWKVRVRSLAHLESWIKDYFAEFAITHEQDGTTCLNGELSDMSAVYGLILLLRDAGVELLSLHVERV